MLRSLSVRDILLVDTLDLEFGTGLSALTGETGAGKSILLDALGAALGARFSGGLVREGAKSGSATAEFALDAVHPARDWLRKQGFADDGETLILRRAIGADGRSRAFIDDQPVSVGALKALSAMLVEIHGQFDDRGLMNPAAHGALLDIYAGLEGHAADLRALHAAWKSARDMLAEAEAGLEEARRDADYVRHSVEELDALAPEEDEEDTLDAERRRMRRAAEIADDVAKAAEVLGPEGAEGSLADAFRRLDLAAPKAEGVLDAPLKALDRAMEALSEAARSVDSASEALAFDPATLEAAEERLFALRGLARKHRLNVAQLAGLRAQMHEKLAFIDAGTGRIADLESAVAEAKNAYLAAAEALSAARRKAAASLDKAVMKELPPLKLDRAAFRTVIESDESRAAADGIDRVSFEVATNPGTPPGPIDQIASGGELSRFLLALKVCLARRSESKTLIFDEIDRGIGGATAAAIGARLRRLGAAGQVLVVTHAPQVAAEASAHWRIDKRVERSGGTETTLTRAVRLDDKARVAELARMLAGAKVTAAARDAARSLLAS